MTKHRKLRIALFFGGTSQEREVSLLSGKNVASNLDKHKYEVVPVEIATDGKWLTSSDAIKEIAAKSETKLLSDTQGIVPTEKNPETGIPASAVSRTALLIWESVSPFGICFKTCGSPDSTP